MPPRLIEVSPDMRDFAEDAMKLGTVSLAGWAINTYFLNKPAPIEATLNTLAIMMAGLALHHLVVDPNLVRFVVAPGTEGYYMAMRRIR